jgi:hypothetical protein
MKRVKGAEDLNICIIGAQGIVGVGAITSAMRRSSSGMKTVKDSLRATGSNAIRKTLDRFSLTASQR